MNTLSPPAYLEAIVVDLVRRHLWRFKSFEPKDALLIFSDPRGGSTWLTEVLASIPRTSVIWEPLDISKIESWRRLGFSWRQHIPEDETWPEAQRQFEHLFQGRVLPEPVLWMTPLRSLIWARRLLFKLTRAKSMLPWMTRQFAFDRAPVFLVRHPFAVVASQLAHGAWNKRIDQDLLLRAPFSEEYRQHAAFLRTLKTREEDLVALWCLTNLVPLRNPRNNRDWITISYEEMVLDPLAQVGRVFSRWNLPIPPIADGIRAPSATTKGATFEGDPSRQLTKWQRTFSGEQRQRMARVLEYFNVNAYTASDPLPRGALF